MKKTVLISDTNQTPFEIESIRLEPPFDPLFDKDIDTPRIFHVKGRHVGESVDKIYTLDASEMKAMSPNMYEALFNPYKLF